MKKEIEFPYESFINGTLIDETYCDKIITHFKKNKNQAKSGKLAKGQIDTSKKVSIDLFFNDEKLVDEFKHYIQKAINEYQAKYKEVSNLDEFQIIEWPNIQYYKKGWGFKEWHNERDCHINRTLVWMLYLNEVEDGGTEFKYQKIKVPARKGLLLMWPTDFTHTHRGIVSNTKEKYILTGWLGYR